MKRYLVTIYLSDSGKVIKEAEMSQEELNKFIKEKSNAIEVRYMEEK